MAMNLMTMIIKSRSQVPEASESFQGRRLTIFLAYRKVFACD